MAPPESTGSRPGAAGWPAEEAPYARLPLVLLLLLALPLPAAWPPVLAACRAWLMLLSLGAAAASV